MKALEILTDEFNKLPGIGRKTAQRLAFYVMEMSEEEVKKFSEAMINLRESVKKCIICGNITENEVCDICSDDERDKKTICILEEAKDLIVMEKTKSYRGVYHIINGRISPLNGIGIEDLNIKSLIERVKNGEIKEVILALNPDLEGDTTALYISKLLKPFNLKISRIARGIPMGGNIEFSDMATIVKAMEGRKSFED